MGSRGPTLKLEPYTYKAKESAYLQVAVPNIIGQPPNKQAHGCRLWA